MLLNVRGANFCVVNNEYLDPGAQDLLTLLQVVSCNIMTEESTLLTLKNIPEFYSTVPRICFECLGALRFWLLILGTEHK